MNAWGKEGAQQFREKTFVGGGGAIKKGWGVWYWEEFKDLINVC